jgi:hypothetical protein
MDISTVALWEKGLLKASRKSGRDQWPLRVSGATFFLTPRAVALMVKKIFSQREQHEWRYGW